MDFRTTTESEYYGVRVTAIIVKEGALLTYRVDNQYHLVGGAINVGESTYDAVIREVKEELGMEVQVNDLMFIVENRFDYEGKLHHMIEFHYQVELLGEAPQHILDGIPYEIEWLPIHVINQIDVRPAFLKTELSKWDGAVHHIMAD